MAIKFLDAIDLTGLEIQNVLLQNSAGTPASTLGGGQIVYDSVAGTLKYYDDVNTQWVELDGQGGVISVTSQPGLISNASTGAITIGPDYGTSKNIILSATNLAGTPVPLEAHIIYSDTKSVVNYAAVQDLPFTANTGTVTGVSGTAPIVSSGGTSPAISISNFTGANGTTAGTKGAVPAPAAADNVKYLKGDGTWATIPSGFAGFDITDGKTPFTVASGNTVSFTSSTLTVDTTTALTVDIEMPSVNSNVGSFTSANITVDAQGRVTAASTGGAGTMSSFDLASDGGTAETVSDGDTVTISGGTALTGTVSANDTVTINHDTFGTAGTYTYPSQIVTNATGHITSVTNGTTPGTMDGFKIAGDTGTAQAIADGDTVTISGSTGIDTVASATGTVTVNLDLCELDPPKGDIDPARDTVAGCFGNLNGQIPIGDIKLNQFGNPTADLDMNGQKIVDMADPNSPQDSATKNYVDTTFAGSGALIYQGGYAADTAAPTGTSVKKGFTYAVTKSGTGVPAGFWSPALEVGDLIIANQDNPTSASDWTEINKNIDVATATVQGIANFPTAGGLSVTAGAVSIPASGVKAATYGKADTVSQITVDDKGIVTGAVDVTIDIAASQVQNFCTEVVSCQTAREKTGTIGNATNWQITHNFGTRNVMVQVYSNTSPYDNVEVKISRSSVNDVDISVAKNPGASALNYMIQKIG